ncbi:MAG: hypothetical protein WAV31_03305 [Candidatus Moraniibacteriota bacterium]
MKKTALMTVLIFLSLMTLVTGSAFATAKYVDVTVSCDENGNTTISPMPAGATLVTVEIYDEVRGVAPDKIGAKTSFKLDRGQAFNFLWKDSEGTWYQMITPSFRPGGHLTVTCGESGCAYIFPQLTK